LAADILSTTVSASFEALVKLAVVAVIRTFLNYFRIEHRLKSQVQYLVENQVDPESIQVVTTQFNQQMIVQVVTDSNVTSPIVTVTTAVTRTAHHTIIHTPKN
jgi:uncharacterized membrane protein YhiD involved in acid resistance